MKFNLINNNSNILLDILEEEILKSQEFYFIVSFIRYSGVQLLLDTLKKAEALGIQGKIITSNYMGITEKRAIEALINFKNIELRYFHAKIGGFHPKGYIFKNKEEVSLIVGSSNLSSGGLKSNIEWNSYIKTSIENNIYEEVRDEFLYIWEKSKIYNSDDFREGKLKIEYIENNRESKDENNKITPNFMQIKALSNLKSLRERGEDKALLISATGSGKTYLSAFDVESVNPDKFLYIAHREEILDKSMESFKKVIPHKTYGKYTGKEKNVNKDYIFASIQSLAKNLSNFKSDEFSYILIDEAHHIGGKTYQNILNYFEPNFLLGLTATPNRTDGFNIYENFNYNIAYEFRLREALDNNLVSPFHYFGIEDIEEASLEGLDLKDIDKIAKKLMINKRSEFILEKINFYKYSGFKMRGLGFCMNRNHAKFMAEEFKRLGIEAIALTGEDSLKVRNEAMKDLENENSNLKFIFTVDIFNEGIDLPNINLVLMLRPTDSAIVFAQQLGRGLRKSSSKDFVTILDFIGNHSKAFLIALGFLGNKTYDKDRIIHSLKNNFINFSKKIHISLDEISRERILSQIEGENFNSSKYLKEEYLNFKNIIGRIPTYLDYKIHEDSPNIYKFTNKSKTYYKFLMNLKEVGIIEEKYLKILEEIEFYLPAKRLEEIIIIKLLAHLSEINLSDIEKEILTYKEKGDKETINHSINNLNWDYLDSRELNQREKLIEVSNGKIKRSELFNGILEDEKLKSYIEEAINFGILEYTETYKTDNDSNLKLHEVYSMREVAKLTNYNKLHSSYRNGINISEDKKTYYLFINLEKEDYEKFKYNNIIFNSREFTWYTKSSTSLESHQGQSFVNNKELGIKLEFFIRKFSKIDGLTEPFVYVGRGDVIEHTGEKPIKCKIRLENKIREDIYEEFIK